MITVITRYEPESDHFDTILDMIKTMLNDDRGARKGCIGTSLYASKDRQDILTINTWQTKADYESFIDGCISSDKVMEIQVTMLRREIDTRIFDVHETRAPHFAAPDDSHVKHASAG